MSETEDRIITKKKTRCGIVDQTRNHILYEHVDGTEKFRIRGFKKPEPKQRELIDNYRYIETKMIKERDERRRSIVKHKRLSGPIGKETPYDPYYKSKTYSKKKKKRNSLDRNSRASSIRDFEYDTRSSVRNSRRSDNSMSKNTSRKRSKEKRIKLDDKSFTKEEYIYNSEKKVNPRFNDEGIYPLNENTFNQNYYQQNNYNERYLDQSQKLPFYPEELKYKSQTERLRFCKRCGKPKKPKDMYSSYTHGFSKQSIHREMIREAEPQDEIVMKYNYENNMNQPNIMQYNYENNMNQPDIMQQYNYENNMNQPDDMQQYNYENNMNQPDDMQQYNYENNMNQPDIMQQYNYENNMNQHEFSYKGPNVVAPYRGNYCPIHGYH